MKKEIGPNDALDVESASIAYVENFGLRVFAGADQEDRKGAATKYATIGLVLVKYTYRHSFRATAKKFLAAANFLEVLELFPISEVGDFVSQVAILQSHHSVLLTAHREDSLR